MPSRESDYSFIANLAQWYSRNKVVVVLFAWIAAAVGFTVLTPAQTSRALSAKIDSLAMATDKRMKPLEQDHASIEENLSIIVRYLCYRKEPGITDYDKQLAGLTSQKCANPQ